MAISQATAVDTEPRSIQAITVCYNTPELITRAVSSVKRFYPDLPIFIVDGSKRKSACYLACEDLARRYPGIQVYHALRNIGHGDGMQYAVDQTRSEYLLLMDSDIQVLAPCLETMQARLTPGALGIGLVLKVDSTGHLQPEGVNYLHPYFCLLNRGIYRELQPMRNHGAPLIDTMLAAHARGIQVQDFDLAGYVEHKWRGTVAVNPRWMQQLQPIPRYRVPIYAAADWLRSAWRGVRRMAGRGRSP